MRGDLFELLIALAVIFFGLLGGIRKKKPPPARRAPTADRRWPSAERRAPAADDFLGRGLPQAAEPSAEGRAPSTGQGEAATREELFSEIERILRGERVERPAPPPEIPEPDEAYSLERLEGESLEGESTEEDLERRHAQFHEKYIAPPPAPATGDSALGARRSAVAKRVPLQQAIVWREILGPPKGLE